MSTETAETARESLTARHGKALVGVSLLGTILAAVFGYSMLAFFGAFFTFGVAVIVSEPGGDVLSRVSLDDESLRFIWMGLFIYLDFEATVMLIPGPVPLEYRRWFAIKSLVFVSVMYLVYQLAQKEE